MVAEEARTRLIGEIAALLRAEAVPDEARAAGLTLICWLARRMPGEAASTAGVSEMVERCRADIRSVRVVHVRTSASGVVDAPLPKLAARRRPR